MRADPLVPPTVVDGGQSWRSHNRRSRRSRGPNRRPGSSGDGGMLVAGLLGGRITWVPAEAAVWTGGAGGGGGGATWTGGAVGTGVRATVVGGAGGAGGTVVVVVVVVGAGRRPLVGGAVGTVLRPAARLRPVRFSSGPVWPAASEWRSRPPAR